jgi:hypothetical protein
MVREKAWGILCEALQDDNADKRAKAVRALGLLPQTRKQRRRQSARSRMTKQMSASQRPRRWDPCVTSKQLPNWKKFWMIPNL